MSTLRIRPGQPSDRPHLCRSFVESYAGVKNGLYVGSPYAAGVDHGVLASLFEALLDAPGWQVAVACPMDEADEIVGWVLYRDATTVGYVHVKERLRRGGIAKAILHHIGVARGELRCAFLATKPNLARIAAGRGVVLRFRPYLPLQAQMAAALALVTNEGSGR